MPESPTIVWFRQDLRLRDNPALAEAIARGRPILPLYILDPAGEGDWPPGGASRWWLHRSLASLDLALRERDSRLLLAGGDSGDVLRAWLRERKPGAIYWNRRYEPAAIRRDAQLLREFTDAGIEVKTFNSALLHEPTEIANREGRPFRVFTPYWRTCLALPVVPPLQISAGPFPRPATWPSSLPLESLALKPRIPWDAGLVAAWQPGEEGGAKQLKKFVRSGIEGYESERNRPDRAGTSLLSPWLHFGEVGPRQVWAAVHALGRSSGVFPTSKGAGVFLSEIGWREFAYHLLYYFPETAHAPLRPEFAAFPWAEDPGNIHLRAWQRGQTGYPIVDAGLRELWHTGWMHNRVRMIAASFLVKHLRLPWQKGAAWFWDTLVDADLASNTLGWQWTAGSGADAAPYFRIFAPVLQGRKFDPDGIYVRRWVPELARLPDAYIHAPWEAPADVLVAAGITLGSNYPRPLVDHAAARTAALDAFRSLRGSKDESAGRPAARAGGAQAEFDIS